MTFLSSMAILTLLVGAWGYYAQQNSSGSELLPRATLLLLNENFPYIVVISLIIVVGEWTYKRPKKRKYEGEKYGALDGSNDEGAPPMR
ncbi:MAG: hypothetical protein V1909_04120 [Candidatus Micrarchaeota archaeon]